MIQLISREEAGLPRFPDSYYPGPYNKVGVCLHNMGVGSPDPTTLDRAIMRTQANYRHHLNTYSGAIDIMEAYDLYNVEGHPVFIEGRPWWSNCDAFSGMAQLGYRYIGLEVHGNYDTQYPNDVILEGISDFLAACCAGGKISGLEMKGHRDFNSLSSYGPTNCPGNNLYPLIPELIAEARRKLEGYGEEEEMIYNLERLPKQGSLFAWGAADVFTRIDNPRHSADYLCWLNVKNESPDPVPIEIFGTPELAAGHPLRDTIPPWEKRGYDIYALAGGHFNGSIILKANQESLLATMTLLRLK